MADPSHDHCSKCFRSVCDDSACPVADCPNSCGFTLHSCKLEDHLLICPSAEVACANLSYGCTLKLPRSKIGVHLAHCPASVVLCKFSWERRPIDVGVVEEKDTPCLYDEELLNADLRLTRSVSPDSEIYLGVEIERGSMNCNHGSKGFGKKGQARQVRIATEKCTVSSYRNYYAHGSLPVKETKHAFWCQCIVRRDEASDHYLWHTVHLGLDGSWFIHRCPLYTYGCPFAIQRFIPQPRGSKITFNESMHTLVVEIPTFDYPTPVGCEEGHYMASLKKKQELAMYGYEPDAPLDPLSQLPSLIIQKILHYLDSFSLLSLSQVSHYFHEICSTLVKSSGIVEIDWTKEERPEMYQKWKESNHRVSLFVRGLCCLGKHVAGSAVGRVIVRMCIYCCCCLLFHCCCLHSHPTPSDVVLLCHLPPPPHVVPSGKGHDECSHGEVQGLSGGQNDI